MLTLLFLTGLFEDLPEATLGAVVIAAVIDLIDIDALRRLYRINSLSRMYGPAARPDFYAAVAALLGVLVFDLLPGLFIGIAVSLLLLLYRAAKPNVAASGTDARGPTATSTTNASTTSSRPTASSSCGSRAGSSSPTPTRSATRSAPPPPSPGSTES